MLETLQATWTQPKDSVGWGKKTIYKVQKIGFHGNSMGILWEFMVVLLDLMWI